MSQPRRGHYHQVLPHHRAAGRRGNGGPVLAACLPMMAGAAVLVTFHRAGLIFLVTFASCTALLAALLTVFS